MDDHNQQLIDGAEVKRIRKLLKFSRNDLSRNLGVSQRFLSQVESGVKPFNKNILDFIEHHKNLLTPLSPTHPPTHPPKNAKKGARNGHLSKVSDFSVLDARKREKWWKTLHPLCQKCNCECKQSDSVQIIICPQFKRKK